MGKSVEWGIEKNYHYELKIGIAEKIFIHSEFNNRKGKKLDFPPFLSPLLPSIHSASALLIIMMLLMLQNVSVYPCRYRERHTILNMSNMAYLYRIHPPPPPPPLIQITKSSGNDTMPSYTQHSFSPANAFYFFVLSRSHTNDNFPSSIWHFLILSILRLIPYFGCKYFISLQKI